MESTVLESVFSVFKIFMALLLVAFNGVFVAAEFAFVRVRPTRITQLVEEGDRRAIRARDCIENLDAYLSVSQLGITLASLGLGWLGEPAIAALVSPALFNWGIHSTTLVHSISFVLAFSLITFFHVVFGELAPKSLAIQRAESLTLQLALPMQLFYSLFYPVVVLLNGSARKAMDLVGIPPGSESELSHSGEELQMIIAESFRGGQINENEQELLQNVFRFEESTAEEIMVPRTEVVFLDTHLSLEENVQLARLTQHTRYPLCEGSPDRVIGLIHIKDILYMGEEISDIRDIKRDILFVPEVMPLDRLLTDFQRKHQHLAVVMDEYGGTSGIVTMDNVLEVLVGDIQDEFDAEEPEIRKESEGSFLVSGRLHIDDAAEQFGLQVDEDEFYNTLAGFILSRLGRHPREGDCVIQGSVKLEVSAMEDNRIKYIRITTDNKKTHPEANRAGV